MESQLIQTADAFLVALNYIGIFVFAISGAVAAMHKRADLFGVVVLAIVASSCGGILRDVLIGSLPPDNIRAWQPVAIAIFASFVTIIFYPYVVKQFNNPVLVFDAFGLGLFTVLGVDKALAFGIGPLWAVLLGMITAVGGGMLRDMLLAQAPQILHKEIYATASVLGGIIVVLGYTWPIIWTSYTMVLGAVACTSLRLLALKYKWQAPVPGVRQES